MTKIPGYIPLLGWMVLLIMFSACTLINAATSESADEAVPSLIPTRSPADERAIGDPNAPVTLIEYGDYQ